MTKFKLGLLVGSNRKDSINRKLAQALLLLGANRFEGHILRIDDLPMYNQDHEAPLPDTVARFKSEIEATDALLIVTPEHSRSIPAVLKNAIDWGARPWGKNSWAGKHAAIAGASPGAIGTAIVQQHLRAVLGDLGVLVMSGEAYITYKPDLVDADGRITDESTRNFLKNYLDQLAALSAKLVTGVAPRAAA